MKTPPFERVVIDPSVEELPFTRQFLARCPDGVAVTVSAEKPKGRRALFVTREPGAFLKPCPCSPGVVGCGYWVLSPAFQCPFACSYCFLRFYAPDEPLTLYANLEDVETQLEQLLAARGEEPLRVGTGEFADSLALEPWSGHVAWLRRLLQGRPQVQLELKTKSDCVDGLLAHPPLPNLVVAWSVNPAARIQRDEIGTATLDQRLDAARRVAAAGYRVAFHFDPVFVDGNWRDEYGQLVDQLFDQVPAQQVAWVSVGTLRFPPRFLERWGRRLKGRPEFFAEFQPGPDGKLRYFWPHRRQLNRWLLARLRQRGGERLPVYLCMETADMWDAVFGCVPAAESVAAYLTGVSPLPGPGSGSALQGALGSPWGR